MVHPRHVIPAWQARAAAADTAQEDGNQAAKKPKGKRRAVIDRLKDGNQ